VAEQVVLRAGLRVDVGKVDTGTNGFYRHSNILPEDTGNPIGRRPDTKFFPKSTTPALGSQQVSCAILKSGCSPDSRGAPLRPVEEVWMMPVRPYVTAGIVIAGGQASPVNPVSQPGGNGGQGGFALGDEGPGTGGNGGAAGKSG